MRKERINELESARRRVILCVNIDNMSSISTDNEAFVYTGPRGAAVPRDVVCVRVDPSVALIIAGAFEGCKKLAKVELCGEGIVETGEHSFRWCEHSMKTASLGLLEVMVVV